MTPRIQRSSDAPPFGLTSTTATGSTGMVDPMAMPLNQAIATQALRRTLPHAAAQGNAESSMSAAGFSGAAAQPVEKTAAAAMPLSSTFESADGGTASFAALGAAWPVPAAYGVADAWPKLAPAVHRLDKSTSGERPLDIPTQLRAAAAMSIPSTSALARTLQRLTTPSHRAPSLAASSAQLIAKAVAATGAPIADLPLEMAHAALSSADSPGLVSKSGDVDPAQLRPASVRRTVLAAAATLSPASTDATAAAPNGATASAPAITFLRQPFANVGRAASASQPGTTSIVARLNLPLVAPATVAPAPDATGPDAINRQATSAPPPTASAQPSIAEQLGAVPVAAEATPHGAVDAASRAAGIDADQLVEAALAKLMLRLEIERERRGFASWA
jgi:hypothetical protein